MDLQYEVFSRRAREFIKEATADCQHWFDDTAKELSQKTLDAIHGAQASLSRWEPRVARWGDRSARSTIREDKQAQTMAPANPQTQVGPEQGSQVSPPH